MESVRTELKLMILTMAISTSTSAILLEASIDCVIHPMSKTAETDQKLRTGRAVLEAQETLETAIRRERQGYPFPRTAFQLPVLPHKRELRREGEERACEMAQWRKALAANAGGLSLYPRDP